jgi:hypothetical protein
MRSLLVFSVSGPTKRARFKSYRVVRQIRLALYCALGERRVDLVGSGPDGSCATEHDSDSQTGLARACPCELAAVAPSLTAAKTFLIPSNPNSQGRSADFSLRGA